MKNKVEILKDRMTERLVVSNEKGEVIAVYSGDLKQAIQEIEVKYSPFFLISK